MPASMPIAAVSPSLSTRRMLPVEILLPFVPVAHVALRSMSPLLGILRRLILIIMNNSHIVSELKLMTYCHINQLVPHSPGFAC